MLTRLRNILISIAVVLSIITWSGFVYPQAPMEEVIVWGQGGPLEDSHKSSSSIILSPEDMISINAMTTEDLVKYEPSLIIRQRYIGDSNGTIGMRSANMFQTTRSMVFADGVPLHYFLQTSYNGSPRWALVSANEIGFVEVVYGPFSAEYSGNSMGGVVNIETVIPTERKFHLEGAMFQQNFNEVGFASNIYGSRLFGSYGDKVGNLSLYTSFIHLENDSQPMDFRFDSIGIPKGGEQEVSGAIQSIDLYGNSVMNYGDTGIQKVNTDQFKIKLGYDFGEWFALMNIAFEDRDRLRDNVNNYLLSNTGEPVWDGEVSQGSSSFRVNRSNFTVDTLNRQSLLLGGRLQGPITDIWWMEADISYFDILKDRTLTSSANPLDPTFTRAGRVRDYDDTGWRTTEVKFQSNDILGRNDLNLLLGHRYEEYSLAIHDYSSNNYAAASKDSKRTSSGGKTSVNAVFAQFGWSINEQWDMVLGGRYEVWDGRDGFFHDFKGSNIQDHINRSEDRFSPKFSLGFNPSSDWQLRYSFAKAFRFPIVEELFQNERRTTGTSLANANLEPEDGLHHNLMLENSIGEGVGYLRLNLFKDKIDDVIFNQRVVVDNKTVSTFLPVDEVTTNGVEFIYNQPNILDGNLDVRFNVTYIDAKITKNSLNIDIEGNSFPRMPKWRGNLVLTYHINDKWDFGGGIRYASNSYGRLDNKDIAENVFGVQDNYTFVGIKSNYRFNEHFRLSLALDNLFDEITYVHHPWPGRTVFIETAFDF